MSTEATTWDVWERRVNSSHGHTTVHEKPIAICATKEHALAELGRVAERYAREAQYVSDCDLPAFLIKPGALLVGFTVLDGGEELEPLSCGCAPGRHPEARNLLESAAERDGRVCALGWPVGSA